jgi:3-oxoacyl-[acyl-carrier protein] reductase
MCPPSWVHYLENMHVLQDRVALITGSSRGIGAAIAKTFAALGAKIALHGRDQTALAKVKAAIADTGIRVEAFVADVTHFEDLERMRGQIEVTLGPVDILVANAGASMAPPCLIEELSEEAFRANIDQNLIATFLTVKAFLPGMKQRKRGSIVTISSAAGRIPHQRAPFAYGVAKAGLELLTQDIALQAGPFGVRANCVAPETILTERNLERIPEQLRREFADAHPLRRLGTPEEVAEAVAFLASDRAAWITGVVLDVAGGAVTLR